MSWGWKITLLYSGFVVMILTFVIASTMQDFHLVTEDYYEEEIRYQTQIDRIKRAQALDTPMQIRYESQSRQVIIDYPETQQNLEGTITLYRPANSRMDKTYDIQPADANVQAISTAELSSGLWKVQVSWQVNGLEYFKEQAIVL